MRTRYLFRLMFCGSAIGILIGCGGSAGSASSEAPDPTLSKAAFIKKALAICEAGRQKSVREIRIALAESTARGESLEAAEVKLVSTLMVPRLDEKVEAVRALPVPPEDETQVAEILDAIAEVVSEAEAHPKRFLFEQAHFKHPFHHAHELAKAYGIGHCARA